MMGLLSSMVCPALHYNSGKLRDKQQTPLWDSISITSKTLQYLKCPNTLTTPPTVGVTEMAPTNLNRHKLSQICVSSSEDEVSYIWHQKAIQIHLDIQYLGN